MPETLRPPNPVTESIARLWVDGQYLCLRLREFSDDFRQTARSLRFQWSSVRYRWERRIDQFNGPLEDRIIEAARELLAAAFIVEIPDASLIERIAAGDYAEERTRWVKKRLDGSYAGWLVLEWGRGEDFYSRARRLSGSRYNNRRVVVPPDQYEEVLDFAEVHGFELSPGAQEIVVQAEARRQQMVRVELQPRARAAAAPAAEEPTGEIDDELKDEGD